MKKRQTLLRLEARWNAGDDLKKEMAYNQIFSLEKAGKYTEAKAKADAYLQIWPDDEDVKKEAEFLETQAGNE